jgi:hypothetical protein
MAARAVGAEIEASPGSDFLEKCKSLRDRAPVDLVDAATCPNMQQAIERAAFRLRRSPATQAAPESESLAG